MASVKYVVDLSEEEEEQLRKFISRGKVSARRAARARILLKANDGLSDEQVAVAAEVGSATAGRIRQRFVEVPSAGAGNAAATGCRGGQRGDGPGFFQRF